MKKFIIKFSLFILPILLLLAFPFSVLYFAGEFKVPSQLLALENSGQRVLYGPTYSQGYIKALKVAMTVAKKPDILVLGDSRTLQIRSDFFNPGTKFYNAGLAISQMQDFRKFLDLIPASGQPKIIFMDVDQQYFSTATYSSADDGNQQLLAQPKLLDGGANMFINSWEHVYLHFFEHKYTLGGLFKKQPAAVSLIGLDSITNLNGFRNDGSYYYGQLISNPEKYQQSGNNLPTILSQASVGSGSFAFGSDVSQPAENELSAFLSECQKRGIYVVGFLAPFPHAVYSEMKDNGKQNYFFKLPATLKPLFAQYNFEFYDFSDLASLGASDKEIIDGAHSSEKAYLRMYLKILAQGSKLSEYSNLPLLEHQLAASKSDYYVFSDNY